MKKIELHVSDNYVSQRLQDSPSSMQFWCFSSELLIKCRCCVFSFTYIHILGKMPHQAQYLYLWFKKYGVIYIYISPR